MADGTGQFITISDRNKAAFLVASGHEVHFELRPEGGINFQFKATTELYAASEAYNQNASVPVLFYVSAQRQLTDAIHDHRQRHAAKR